MIKFTVHFWTDKIPKEKGDRTAWASGSIHIVAMKSRGIKHNQILFNSRDEFMPKFQELMDRNQIELIRMPKKVETVRIA